MSPKVQPSKILVYIASMFAIIVASLIVAIVWNFANAASMKASFAGKQVEINALTQSIMGLKEELRYMVLSTRPKKSERSL